ncbi:unnamed protein product [Rhizoctonia solani]|uniref:BTB domain-containing protein n=1 Tax=Rhizoctonia solani TaxID=456999 RepID=A0A8H3BFV6_9AGAM|nr:unnamed protein product [Rhizoctonia solani]
MRSADVGYGSPVTPDSDSGKIPDNSGKRFSTPSSYEFVFDREDGDIELQLNNTLFKTRKYLLNKFGVLAELLRDAESTGRVSAGGPTPLPRVAVKCDTQLIGDFNNTLKVLYASVIEGPFDFDTATLISALRVSSVYGYDALRQFSISKLERAELSAIQRIKIAQELDVAHWTEPAFEELANRVEPIQPEEARILGIDSLLRVSNMREQRRARRGDDESTLVSDTDTLMGARSKGKLRAQSSSVADGDCDESDFDEDIIYHLPNSDDDMLGEKAKTCMIGVAIPGVRTHVPSKSRRQRLEFLSTYSYRNYMPLSISPLSTPPVSVAITPSVVSEIERMQGNPEVLKMPDPVAPFGSGEPNTVSDAPTVIDLGDGDIELRVNNTVFKSHKHLLNDFSRLKELIKGMERYNSGTPCITVYRDERGVEDFKNMFKVLYASLIKGPFEFEAPVLISSLRIATAYEYPELRKFSIDRLESASLSAIQRIELAREFDLTAWDERAFQELVGRDEPITKDEAKMIGFERFEELARARENEKLKKGMEEGSARRDQEEKRKRDEEERKKQEEEKRQREEEEKKKCEEQKQREEEEKRQREEAERVAREEEERKKQEEAKRAEDEQKKKDEEEKAKQE